VVRVDGRRRGLVGPENEAEPAKAPAVDNLSAVLDPETNATQNEDSCVVLSYPKPEKLRERHPPAAGANEELKDCCFFCFAARLHTRSVRRGVLSGKM
jgi:hypothetical protein